MDEGKFLYLLPYLASLGLSLGILIYAFNHRRVRGAREFFWYSLAQTLWVAGFIIEMLTPGVAGKIRWDKFQWLASLIIPVVLPVFVVRYTGYKLPHLKKLAWTLWVVPILFGVAVLTDPLHHALYPFPHLRPNDPFPELGYDFTWPAYLYAAYAYSTAFGSLIFLVLHAPKPGRLYRFQVLTIAAGALIPIAGTFLALTGLHLTPQRDPTPFASAIGNLVIALGIFRFHVLDIVHIAREKVFENLTDLVIVLDARDRVVDMNASALSLLELSPAQAIGKAAGLIFAEWPVLIEHFDRPTNANLEVIVKRNEIYFHFDVKSTLLFDRGGVYQGRVFVARDITPYARLQWELKELNEDLEQRVADRTKELAEAYDTTLEGWAKALELRDKETEGHSRRVTAMTLTLARALGINGDELDNLRRGAILHDIGKMGISDDILRKEGPLTDEEWTVIHKHPVTAYTLLQPIQYLSGALDIPYCHHEKWDGSGYPRGLRGEEIPLAARIFTIADVWDALLSDRPYNKAWEKDQAIAYMQKKAGENFDPRLVAIFLGLVENGKI